MQLSIKGCEVYANWFYVDVFAMYSMLLWFSVPLAVCDGCAAGGCDVVLVGCMLMCLPCIQCCFGSLSPLQCVMGVLLVDVMVY